MKKKLKSPKGMEFVARQVEEKSWGSEITDIFLHIETGVKFHRVNTRYANKGHKSRQRWQYVNWYCPELVRWQYVNWYCPELGGGCAGLEYWIRIAKSKPRLQHAIPNKIVPRKLLGE